MTVLGKLVENILNQSGPVVKKVLTAACLSIVLAMTAVSGQANAIENVSPVEVTQEQTVQEDVKQDHQKEVVDALNEDNGIQGLVIGDSNNISNTEQKISLLALNQIKAEKQAAKDLSQTIEQYQSLDEQLKRKIKEDERAGKPTDSQQITQNLESKAAALEKVVNIIKTVGIETLIQSLPPTGAGAVASHQAGVMYVAIQEAKKTLDTSTLEGKNEFNSYQEMIRAILDKDNVYQGKITVGEEVIRAANLSPEDNGIQGLVIGDSNNISNTEQKIIYESEVKLPPPLRVAAQNIERNKCIANSKNESKMGWDGGVRRN